MGKFLCKARNAEAERRKAGRENVGCVCLQELRICKLIWNTKASVFLEYGNYSLSAHCGKPVLPSKLHPKGLAVTCGLFFLSVK